MKKILVNANKQEELRIALVNNRKLFDLNIEILSNIKKKLNIYKGKVVRIEPSLQAVFIDYGTKRYGFLPFKKISNEYYFLNKNCLNHEFIKFTNPLYKGQEIIVQIDKEERGNKGAVMTTFINLVSSYLILMPNNPYLGISKNILGINRSKLKIILSSLPIPKGMGIILRTASVNRLIKDFQFELTFCLKYWKIIKQIANNNTAPFLIHQNNNIIQTFLKYLQFNINEILIDNFNIMNLIKNYIKLFGKFTFLNKIKFYNNKIPIFIYYKIESKIRLFFQRKINLPSGGFITIDHTEALTAIDINSGKSKHEDIENTALNTNMEAILELTYQLRLRNLSGLIIIDFIDMFTTKNKFKVEYYLNQLISKDHAKIKIGKISNFGLLELSRQYLGLALNELYHHEYLKYNNKYIVNLSLFILKILEEIILQKNIYRIYLILPTVIAFHLLNKKKKEIINIENYSNKQLKIIIIPSSTLLPSQYISIKLFKFF